jgi:phospholipid/cholesterol/gamma-HCH transport system substrate-binding protein
VIVASVTLCILIFLMSGTVGLFTPQITLYAYFDNAEGLIVGAPVDLQGVVIGNVKSIKVVPSDTGKPVQVTMKVNTKYQFLLRKDTVASIQTAGVLGQSFIDLNSKGATEAEAKDGDTLSTATAPGLSDVVRASQGTLQNLDVLVKRLDRIVEQVENGKGSVGKLINDPTLVNKANAVLAQMQALISDVSNGKGTVGKFFVDDSLYRKADLAIDKLNAIIDQINRGEGNAGKFLKDSALYDNANQTISKANKLMDDINAGHGLLGKITKDEAFAKKLDDTIDKLSQVAAKLDDTKSPGSLGLLIYDPSVYNNTDQLLTETRTLIKSVREDPKKYLTIHLKIF